MTRANASDNSLSNAIEPNVGQNSAPDVVPAGKPAQDAMTAPLTISRIVVKVGTSTLTNAQGRIDRAFIADLTAQLAQQRVQGRDVVLVTSGAIRAGKEALEEEKRRRGEEEATGAALIQNQQSKFSAKIQNYNSLPYKQAAAAIGQGLLMHTYTEAFAWRDVNVAQILLTRDDLSDRSRFLNAQNTLRALLDLGVVPIINENDTVAVDEIKFGDNDTLAALVATLVDADLLLILSDVEGLYAQPPGLEEEKRRRGEEETAGKHGGAANNREGANSGSAPTSLISTVRHIDNAIAALGGEAASGVGTGGMRTKIEAARIATSAGVRTVIARGRRERVIADVVEGNPVGTTFLPRRGSERLSARKRWLAHGARARGTVTVNARARERLVHHGVSLLAVGIVSVSGTFGNGDLIAVQDESGEIFARGLTNYADGEIRRVLGLRSEQFETALGYRGCEEIIHRDNLVLSAEQATAN